MAKDPVSQGREPARVPRDHLPKPLYSSAWSIEKRAHWTPSVQTPHPPLAALEQEWTCKGSDHRGHLDPGTTSGDRGPSDPRTLGGRSHQRHKKQPHRDPGGTALTLHDAHQDTQ